MQCVSNSEAASGPHTSLQGTDAVTSLPGSRNITTRTPDPHPRGWVRRAGNPPPCAASFFPYSFFAGEERIWPPEGGSPFAWKKFKTQRLPASKKSPKLQPQCVSNSEAASGLLTGHQGTDAVTSLSGSWYCSTHATDTHPRGWVRRAGNTPPCAASFFPYSFFAGEERIWPPEGGSPIAWKILRRSSYQPRKIPQATTAVRKQQRSGKRSAHRLSGHGCTGKSAW